MLLEITRNRSDSYCIVLSWNVHNMMVRDGFQSPDIASRDMHNGACMSISISFLGFSY